MKDFIKELMWGVIFDILIVICIYFLWNWLMPDIISPKKITLLQAWMLKFLVNLLIHNRDFERKK
jgi:hypothetical protein